MMEVYGHGVGMAFQLVDDWSSTAPTPDARDLAIGKRPPLPPLPAVAPATDVFPWLSSGSEE